MGCFVNATTKKNRPGNRPSHEGAAALCDRYIAQIPLLGVLPPKVVGGQGTPSPKILNCTWVSPETTRSRNKLGHNNHDANIIILHRVRNFRPLVFDRRSDLWYNWSAHMIGPKQSQSPADSSQE